jgi:D-alanyl-lipoteichoic acid acyltransferase DltB (MBOAT superfamily)
MLSIDFEKIIQQLTYKPESPLLFNSGLFLFLFLAFMAVYMLIYRNEKMRIYYVIAFSLYFYYKSSGFYFILLLLLATSDFGIARLMAKQIVKSRKIFLLIISLIINLGSLSYFKYTNFLFSSFYELINKPFDPFAIFLPVGISFFTFRSLSYTIDVYRGKIEPLNRWSDYTFYLTFFPQMLAGPIVRAVDFIPQIGKTPHLSKADLGKAVFLICAGLFKKAVISDYISLNFVDRIFDNPSLYTGLENLLGVYGYTLQIYCDFSGYSDMAIGITLLMGYKVEINFDSPYQSSSITEFWRRWHISLSTWLREYLYIPLGGNRKGRFRTYVNLVITMLLGGLWHGAAMRFILWGGLHGLMLAIEKFFKSLIRIPENKFTRLLGIIFTFHFVAFCWIFFKVDDLKTVNSIITQIFTAFHPEVFSEFLNGYPLVSALMLLGYILHFVPRSAEQFTEKLVTASPLVLKVVYLFIIIFIVIQIKSSEIQPFIYFQF